MSRRVGGRESRGVARLRRMGAVALTRTAQGLIRDSLSICREESWSQIM